jgi:hypothetical protein
MRHVHHAPARTFESRGASTHMTTETTGNKITHQFFINGA